MAYQVSSTAASGVTLSGSTIKAAGYIHENLTWEQINSYPIKTTDMTVEEMREAIRIIDGRAETECSGNVTKENVANLFGLTDPGKIITATAWIVVIMDMIMTFMGSTSNDSAFNAWVTDVTTTATRPKVETAFTFVGFLAMGIVMGVGSFAQAGTVSYTVFFGGLGLLVIVSGIIGLFSLKEPEHKEPKEKNTSYWADLLYGFRPSVIKENSQLYLILSSICIFNIAFQVFFPYLFVYLQYVVLADKANATLLDPISPALIIVGVVAIAALVAGIVILMKLSDKNKFLGFIPGVLLLIAGLFVFSTGTSLFTILAGLAPTFIGYLVLTIQFGASIRDFTPPEKTGLFQGIRMIFAVMLPMVIGPVIGDMACQKAAQTIINEANAEVIVPAKNMFLWAGIVCVFALIPLYFLIKKGVDTEEKVA